MSEATKSTFEIKLTPPKRKGSPRAKTAVRARVAHTATNKRRLDIYVTKPVMDELGWSLGGAVAAHLDGRQGAEALIRISPAHSGLRVHRSHRKSTTGRVAVTTDALARGVCAPVRDVPFETVASSLVARLPAQWFEAA